jgi:hypothetical protein
MTFHRMIESNQKRRHHDLGHFELEKVKTDLKRSFLIGVFLGEDAKGVVFEIDTSLVCISFEFLKLIFKESVLNQSNGDAVRYFIQRQLVQPQHSFNNVG